MPGGRIPDDFIQDLLARTDIVSVIEGRVDLKRAGREYMGLCPFHSEKTPSFTVSPQKQFYHCFGCGAHGSAIGFLMDFDRLEFVDAIEELAKTAGMEVPRTAATGPRPDESLYGILAEAEQFFRSTLKQSPGAIEYLKERGLSGELARQFRLGAAPSGWQGLTDALGTSPERLKLLERAGLITAKDTGGYYDKFRGRIIFPIHDMRGRPLAFGGRIYGDESGPKYLNSPETELFHKGRELYGLYEARQAVGPLKRLLVVEGYMDVLALAQFDLPETVATLGTATTEEHAALLFRSASEVVFCFDGDQAGRRAARRAMQSTLGQMSEGRQVRFLFVPDGEDPDSLVRSEGADGLRDRIEQAIPFSEFFFGQYRAEVDMSSLDGRSRLVELARPELEKLPAGSFRDMMFERLSELARTRVGVGGPPRRPMSPGAKPGARVSLVRSAIRAIVQAPGLAAEIEVPSEVRKLDYAGLELLLDLLTWAGDHPEATTAQLLERYAEHPHAKALAKLAGEGLLTDDDKLRLELAGALRGLERRAIKRRLENLQSSELGEIGELHRRLRELEALG